MASAEGQMVRPVYSSSLPTPPLSLAIQEVKVTEGARFEQGSFC